jgi:hypothetical protein
MELGELVVQSSLRAIGVVAAFGCFQSRMGDSTAVL